MLPSVTHVVSQHKELTFFRRGVILLRAILVGVIVIEIYNILILSILVGETEGIIAERDSIPIV